MIVPLTEEIDILQQQFTVDDYANCIIQNKGIFLGQVRWCSKLFTGEWKTHFLEITDQGSLIHAVNRKDMAKITSVSPINSIHNNKSHYDSPSNRHAIINNIQGSTIKLLKSRNIVPIIHIETSFPELNNYYLKVSSTSKFKELLIVLTWWSSMKTTGLFNKISLSKQNTSQSQSHKTIKDGVVCQLNVFGLIPQSKHVYVSDDNDGDANLKEHKNDQYNVDFLRNANKKGYGWFPTIGTIGSNGTMNLLSQIDGSLIYSIDMSTLLRSEIHHVDNSLLPDSFFILLSENETLRKRFKMNTHFKVYEHAHSKNSICNEILLEFPLKVDMDQWLHTLNAMAIDEKLSLNGIDSTNQLRISNYVKINILEANMESIKLDSGGKFGLQIKLLANGQVVSQTSTIFNQNVPFWREEFQLNEIIPIYDLRFRVIHKTYSSAGIMKSNILSEIILNQDMFIKGKYDKETWMPVCDVKNSNFQIGALCFKLHNNLQLVLSDNNYSKFESLLLRCPTGSLVKMVHERVEKRMSLMESISRITLNIFQFYNREIEWFQNLIGYEMKKISQGMMINDQFHHSMFRGNSLFTISVEKYFNRIGKEYLLKTMGKVVKDLNDKFKDISFEIDPQRIHQPDDDGGVISVISKSNDTSDSGNMTDCEKQIAFNEKNLLSWLSKIWDIIRLTSNDLPVEMKQILKSIRQHLEMTFLDKEKLQEVMLYSISSVLFLRFFCPIILNPKIFNVIPDHSSVTMRRNLTIISKVLLNFSTLNYFGLKESWLSPINDKFITPHKYELIEYIEKVTEKKLDFSPRKLKFSESRIKSAKGSNDKSIKDSLLSDIDIKCNEMELINILNDNEKITDMKNTDIMAIGELEFESITEDNTEIFGDEFKSQLQIDTNDNNNNNNNKDKRDSNISDTSSSNNNSVIKSTVEEIKQEAMLINYKLNHLKTLFDGYEYPIDAIINNQKYIKSLCHSMYLNKIAGENDNHDSMEIVIDMNGINKFSAKLFDKQGIFNYGLMCQLRNEEGEDMNSNVNISRKGSLTSNKSRRSFSRKSHESLDTSKTTNTTPRRRLSRITSKIIGRDESNKKTDNSNSSSTGLGRWFSVKR